MIPINLAEEHIKSDGSVPENKFLESVRYEKLLPRLEGFLNKAGRVPLIRLAALKKANSDPLFCRSGECKVPETQDHPRSKGAK